MPWPVWIRAAIFVSKRLSPRYQEWLAAIQRVHASYMLRHGRRPRLLRPRRYSEKMQWRKLFDLNPLFAVFSDRIAVRDFIATRIGDSYLVPLLWSGDDPERVPFETLDPPYVIKSSHASGHVIIVGQGVEPDVGSIRNTMKAWLGFCLGTTMDEPGYVHVPRRVVIERQVRDADGSRPTERRLFAFDGRVQFVQTTIADGAALRNAGFHTRNWRRLNWYLQTPLREGEISPPKRFDDLIALTEKISQGLDHVRVDFYDCGDRFWIGEITVYTWSGLEPMHPHDADDILGSFWTIRWPLMRSLNAVLFRRRAIFPPGQTPPPAAPQTLDAE